MTAHRDAIVLLLVAATSVAAAAPHRRHRERKHQHARTLVAAPAALPAASADPPAPTAQLHARLDLVTPTAPPSELSTPPPPPAIVAPPVSPPARHDDVGRRRRWGLFGGGLALLLGGYALDVGATYGVGHQPATTSLIPLVGPLLQLGDNWSMVAPSNTGNPQIDGPANERIASVNHTIQTAATAVLAVDFVLQLAGTTLAAVGAIGSAPPKYASTGTRIAWRLEKNGVAVTF